VKIPNPKIQNPNKLQAPSSKPDALGAVRFWNLNFGAYLGFGIWDLEFTGGL
jgi:hypothetical protein